MKSISMFGASAIMLALGLVCGHLAVSQGDLALAYAAGAAVCGLSGLAFIGAALKTL